MEMVRKNNLKEFDHITVQYAAYMSSFPITMHRMHRSHHSKRRTTGALTCQKAITASFAINLALQMMVKVVEISTTTIIFNVFMIYFAIFVVRVAASFILCWQEI